AQRARAQRQARRPRLGERGQHADDERQPGLHDPHAQPRGAGGGAGEDAGAERAEPDGHEPGAREGREGGRALHRLADEAQVREGPLVQRGRRAIRGRRRRRGHTACWRLSPYSVKSFMNQSQMPPTAAPRLRRRNFGRAKVGCYDETAVVKGVSVEPSVRLIPLGGLGEIGLNMMLIESGDDVVAVDCGLMFPDDELPGVDYVIPDFSYALAKREGFRGVVLTHGHEDHIGALPYLLKSARVPVYATPLTRARRSRSAPRWPSASTAPPAGSSSRPSPRTSTASSRC